MSPNKLQVNYAGGAINISQVIKPSVVLTSIT